MYNGCSEVRVCMCHGYLPLRRVLFLGISVQPAFGLYNPATQLDKKSTHIVNATPSQYFIRQVLVMASYVHN